MAWQQDDAAGNAAITEAGGIEFAVQPVAKRRECKGARRAPCPFQFSAALIDQGQHLAPAASAASGSSAATLPSASTQTSQPAHERDRLATEDNRCRLDAIEQALRKIEDAALTPGSSSDAQSTSRSRLASATSACLAAAMPARTPWRRMASSMRCTAAAHWAASTSANRCGDLRRSSRSRWCAAGRTFEQGVDRRRSAGRGQFPARLVRDQDLLPFEQGADAARSQPILGDQRDPPQPSPSQENTSAAAASASASRPLTAKQ